MSTGQRRESERGTIDEGAGSKDQWLTFQDFVPREQESARRYADETGVLRHSYMRESMAALMQRVNKFLHSGQNIKVISVETLQFPHTTAACSSQFKREASLT